MVLIFNPSPPKRFDQAQLFGQVASMDCASHQTITFTYGFQGRTYTNAGSSPVECEGLRLGQSVPVWIDIRRPEWGSLVDLKAEHTRPWGLILFVILGVPAALLLGVLRLLPRVLPNGRLGREPWSLT
jgi:hypothetical protein